MSTPYYEADAVTLHHGDCLRDGILASLPDASVDAVVTDPPYNLSFMGRDWDRFTALEFEEWCAQWAAECLRVLKPGGHLLAFGGTRTYHRLTAGIEDAGFEIRDSITWLYASGFPKSLDVSKAIDKARDDRDHILAITTAMADAAEAHGITRADVDAHMGTSDMGGWWLSRLRHRCACPRWDQWLQLKALLGLGDEHDAEVWRLNGRKGTPGEAWDQREVIGQRTRKATGRMAQGEGGYAFAEEFTDTAPATDAARAWQGWGTALKPAQEPIVVARKPLTGTVAQNVVTHGTGALNIDACRVGTEPTRRTQRGTTTAWEGGAFSGERVNGSDSGRWPSNLVLTHAPDCAPEGARDGGLWACVEGCPVRELDRQSGQVGSFLPAGKDYAGGVPGDVYSTKTPHRTFSYGDSGGASRFFPTFCHSKETSWPANSCPTNGASTREEFTTASHVDSAAVTATTAAQQHSDGPVTTVGPQTFRYQPKAPTTERPRDGDTAHPTVKPLDLMRWLVRLVTPPGGKCLDLFAGSGTTGEACVLEGFDCILIEREAAYLPLIVTRLSKPLQPGLFGGVA